MSMANSRALSSTGGSRTPGVTDIVCAPWMFVDVAPGTPEDEALSARLDAVRWFADEIVAKFWALRGRDARGAGCEDA